MKKQIKIKELATFVLVHLVVFAYFFLSPIESSSNDNINNIAVDYYPSVIIGTQEWMTENLEIDHFRNGDSIPEIELSLYWLRAGNEQKPASCYAWNGVFIKYGENYGKLYNWYAVNDSRGLAPKGWHIPSEEEWNILTAYLATKNEYIGNSMKSTRDDWNANYDATNSSGFSGLPGGYRSGGSGGSGTASFEDVHYHGYWWSSTSYNSKYAGFRELQWNSASMYMGNADKVHGLSVRCLRD